MKVKFIAALGLAAAIGASGACKSSSNTNSVLNTNTSVNMATPTPVVKTTESAATDPNLKSKIEAALKAKGFTDITVDTTTTPATLRGSYPKARLAELTQTVQEANGGKPAKNEATGK